MERYDESLAQSQANPENQGHELVYTNITGKGMSGGLVLDSQGRVIGFHAAADGDALEEVLLGYSFGVPTGTFVGLAKRLGMQQKWLQVETTVAPVLSQAENNEVRQNLFATTVPSGNSDARDWVNYGNQLWRIFEYDAAVQAFDQAVQRKPDFYQAWYARGLALKDLRKYPEAIASFEQAIKHRADFYPAWQQKATTLSFLKKFPEALTAVDRAIAISTQQGSPNAVLYWEKGLYLGELKRYEEAAAAYTKAIEIKPHSFAYNNRGVAYDDLGDYQKAISDYNEAIRLNPEDADAYYSRGLAYYNLKDYQKAISDYNEAIRLNPENAAAYYSRGLAYNLQGNSRSALESFRKAAELYQRQGNQEWYQNALARIRELE